MITVVMPEALHWAASLATIVTCLALARYVLLGKCCGVSGRPGRDRSELGQLSTAAEDYPDLGILEHPHLEIAMDPPQGLQCSNPYQPCGFENDLCVGSYLALHPPTWSGSEGAGSLDYRDYFKGKKRMWEYRVTLRFKQPPPAEEDIFFGIELEKYVPLSNAMTRVVRVATTALQKAVGSVYQSPGDDPMVVHGECERPTCVLPLWAFDQFIETPEGDEPPSLTDVRFPHMGKKRHQRVNEYAQEIAALRSSFRVGPSYTFALWGPTRFLDAINWRLIGIPLITPLDFDKLVGSPPVHAVLYALRQSSDEQQTRHLVSRKRYLFRAAIWSSNRRPSHKRVESLSGAKMMHGVADMDSGARKQKRGLRRHIGRMGKAIKEAAESSVYCCTTASRKGRRCGA